MSARCELTDLLVEQCAHCRPVEPKPEKVGPRIVAQYNGYCPECGDGIDQGDTIVRTDDGWVHENC
jgi:hypothetical protein